MADTESDGKGLRCVIVTPERALVDEPADFIALPLYDGEIGILRGRAPLVGRLGCGELRIRTENRTQHFFVDGGFVQVRDNVVSVLTARAERASEIKVEKANEVLKAALAPASDRSPEERLKAQERARAQLRVAEHAGAAPSHGQEGHG